MATVFRREGSPYFHTAFFDADGRRVYRSTKQKRKAEAVRAASEMELASRRVGEGDEDSRRILAVLEEAAERAMRRQMSVSVAKGLLDRILEIASGEKLYDPSIEEWLCGWVAEKRRSRASKTVTRYEGVISKFLDALPEKKRRSSVGSLTINDIRAHRDKLLEGGRTEVTANSVVQTLRIPLNAAKRQGIIVHNPAEGVELLTERSSEKDVFTPEQVMRLVDVAEGDWKGLILAGYYTGARIGDLSKLEWSSVDLEEGVIRFVQNKTKREVQIPIHAELKRWLSAISEERRSGPVFPKLARLGASGVSPLSNRFRRLMKEAGIEGTVTERKGKRGKSRSSLSFHSLRHSFNSAMANAGVPQEVRQRLTGHASKAMNDHYTHTEFEVLQDAVDKVPTLVSGRR